MELCARLWIDVCCTSFLAARVSRSRVKAEDRDQCPEIIIPHTKIKLSKILYRDIIFIVILHFALMTVYYINKKYGMKNGIIYLVHCL